MNNIFAFGGLSGEVFIWDIEVALLVNKLVDTLRDENSNGTTSSENIGLPITSLRSINSSSNISAHAIQSHRYCPIVAKGHKEFAYASVLNGSGTLVFDGIEKGRVEELLVAEELWNAHTKPFFFPFSSAATCTNYPLEVDQRHFSPSGLNTGFLEKWDFLNPEGDYEVQEEEQVEDGNASE
ncbi:hypothetical protein Taro_053844 [Colocasia esculenta]|uniref:Uncharacterized protein n=1 Tax=Colocasia esculenta TaxID=4460 RepID=A0A843XNA9_COLES|nr:hypothetical protein [Colocasia esculenta]